METFSGLNEPGEPSSQYLQCVARPENQVKFCRQAHSNIYQLVLACMTNQIRDSCGPEEDLTGRHVTIYVEVVTMLWGRTITRFLVNMCKVYVKWKYLHQNIVHVRSWSLTS